MSIVVPDRGFIFGSQIFGGDAGILGGRRRGPSLPADLVALLATEPTALVQFRYNFLAGRHVLFQDPPCTVPVEEDGDPIGGIIQPSLTLPPSEWSIVGVQGTDAKRPVWGGVEVGAVFDGAQNLALDSSWQRNPGQPSTWVYREYHPDDRNQVIGGWSAAANTDVAYAFYYRISNGIIQRVGTGGTSLVEDVIPHDTTNTFSVRNDTTNYTARVNGTDIQTRATGTQDGDPTIDASLGSLAGDTQFFIGEIQFAVMFDRSLSVSDLQRLEAL